MVQPKVAILLCTYNGQKYLAEQLDSFLAQTHKQWELWASDDGSQDETCHILETYQNAWTSNQLNIKSGPRNGFSSNFMSLTCRTEIEADYYAFSDQDDIWEADKLERAVHWLSTIPNNIPAFYCSRTQLIDSENREIGLSPLFEKPPSFANALMQNIGGGNTMVFNNATRDIICQFGENIPVVTHDWWVYLVVTGCGGEVFYDKETSLRYRQHQHNLVGMNDCWNARVDRLFMLWQGGFRRWNDINTVALHAIHNKLTLENKKILEYFSEARKSPLVVRLIYLKRSGVYRQTFFGNIALIVAAVLKKF